MKSANNMADAYNNAKSFVCIVSKYSNGAGGYYYDNYFLPKIQFDVQSSMTIYRGYYYSASINFATGLSVSKTSASLTVYKNTAEVTDKALYYYYDD